MENILFASWRYLDIFGKVLVLFLLCISIYSWHIIIDKFFVLKRVEKNNRVFSTYLMQGRNPEFIRCPLASILNYARKVKKTRIDTDKLSMHVEKAYLKEQGILERKLTSLATIATISPFVGLLGTVWGLLVSFQSIVESGSSAARVVAGGVGVALVTTIVGLAVAIPAAIGYNYYKDKVLNIMESMEFVYPYMLDFLRDGSSDIKRDE